MEFFGINFGALFQNPVVWIGYLVAAVAGLPVATFLLDNLTQLISDGMVKLNKQIIDKIPIVPIRDWLEGQQIAMLERSIKRYQETIEKIKK